MKTIIDIFLTALALYFAIGFLSGIYFLIKGAAQIDPVLADSKKSVRILLLPGLIATWPFFIGRFFNPKNQSS